ncbi:hypothetical protein LZ480_08120 [Solibacillus sp. MA9]|uniref:Stage III sporulation protein AG n=1 Tax=Solibacillus palustris TaxID=2908203 RepID=A0ABS9UBX7_9BACL|nr:hypothetical protein [Solibacillus sp. MA9]MCH7321857.1 hypothetical protein [Solibacillus sp. MA9]
MLTNVDKSRAKRPLFIVFVLIVVLSIFMVMSLSGQSEQTDIPEQQLAKILSEMEDVGQVFVYFHYEQQKEKQFLAVTQQQNITGVIIVAQGAQDVHVQRLLKQTVGNVLQIPTHRIQVVAMQPKEEAK